MNFKVILHIVWNKLRLYLSFFLLAFYLIVGCLFLFSDIWVNILPEGREIVGAVLLAFATLRFFVAYRRYKHKQDKIRLLKEQRAKTKKNKQPKEYIEPEQNVALEQL